MDTTTMAPKVYRDAEQVPCVAMAAAAGYLEREWGESRTLGFVSRWRETGDETVWFGWVP